jgi:hypothetical protein
MIILLHFSPSYIENNNGLTNCYFCMFAICSRTLMASLFARITYHLSTKSLHTNPHFPLLPCLLKIRPLFTPFQRHSVTRPHLLCLPPTGMFSTKSGTPYTIFPSTPPSNTLKDTKTAITPMIASLSLSNSMWMQILQQDTSDHSMASITHTSPFSPMLVSNSK